MNQNKKGFTIVELVIVIAVIAILAAVLIPTFSGIIQKANLSNDIQIARNMNTQLATDGAFEKPDNVVEAKGYLSTAGYSNSYVPKSSDYHYYWYETNNTVYLVNDSDNGFNVYFPEDEENTNVTKDNSYRLDLEYCLLTGDIAGLTFSKNALVVGEENEVTIIGDSVPNKIKIGTEILTVTDGKFTITPSSASSLAISQDTTVYVSSVSVNPTTLNLYVGGNSTLNAVIDPNDADNKNVTWSSSDDNVATVSTEGIVNAISAGTATITVTTEDGNKTGTCNVTVTKNTANVTAPTAKTGLVYTGSPLELVNAGETDGGVWQYKLNDGEYSTDVPTATNGGTYTVYYKLVGGESYNDIAEDSVEVKISYSITCDYSDIVTADSDNPTQCDSNETVTLKFSRGGNSWDALIIRKDNAGGEGLGEVANGTSETFNETIFTWSVDGTDGTLTIENLNYNVYIYVTASCFAAGTKITMADGTLKNIEDITEGEEVLTFNHEKGIYEGQKVYLAYAGSYKAKAFTLHFDNGETLSIVGEHDLFEQEALKYVTIRQSTAEQFIGKHFYSVSEGRYLELVAVTYETEAVDFYSLYTEYNANCIANGMLSVPDDSDAILNIYEFNEDLTIDHEQLEKDIAEYGLYEYSSDVGYSEELYNILGWKYSNIVVGKGLDTWENVNRKVEEYLSDLY